MVLTTTYCAALCINLFFGWDEEKSWNLGEWVNDNTIENTSGYVNAYVYSNEDENVGVKISKSDTVNGCARYIINVSKLRLDKPSTVLPGELGIRNFCAEQHRVLSLISQTLCRKGLLYVTPFVIINRV